MKRSRRRARGVRVCAAWQQVLRGGLGLCQSPSRFRQKGSQKVGCHVYTQS